MHLSHYSCSVQYSSLCIYPEWAKGLAKSLWTPHPKHTPSLNCYRLVWSTLQSSEHQNDQTQEQFLPSGNPSHEHLTINVEHTTLLYNYLFITHTCFHFNLHISYLFIHNCLYYILCFCFFVHYLLYICTLFLLSVSCAVAVAVAGASVTITNSSYVLTYLAIKLILILSFY